MPFTVLGVFIGALLVQYASYHWVFWFVAIVAIPIALGCLFIIPSELAKPSNEPDASSTKWKSLDLIGISILTGVSHPRELLLACGVNWLPSVALILFIYAVTSGSSDGWATAGVLAPLIISIFLIVGFFYWETLIPFENAAMYVTPFLPVCTSSLFSGPDPLARGFTAIFSSSLVLRSILSFGGVQPSSFSRLCGKMFFTGRSSRPQSICKRSPQKYCSGLNISLGFRSV